MCKKINNRFFKSQTSPPFSCYCESWVNSPFMLLEEFRNILIESSMNRVLCSVLSRQPAVLLVEGKEKVEMEVKTKEKRHSIFGLSPSSSCVCRPSAVKQRQKWEQLKAAVSHRCFPVMCLCLSLMNSVCVQLTDSDYEDEQPKHSFVNHYMSDPTYYNSWKRQPKGLKGIASPFAYEECATADTEPYYQTVVTQHSTGGAYTPTGQPAHTHVNPNTNPPGSRTPVTGFSSFVWL